MTIHLLRCLFISSCTVFHHWRIAQAFPFQRPSSRRTRLHATESVALCVIGGGVSGLTAALTAAQKAPRDAKIVLLESSPTVGGRVQSDVTASGFILDRGFAVFIEQYPLAQELLDYDRLELQRFLPGALVKLSDRDELARVADPLRQPQDILAALFAPVGSLADKFKVLPLVWHVKTKSIQQLFEEPETDTLTALRDRWGFSDDMIDKFFRPFLEGIYLAPLSEQSSRMFSFVFKMFSDGSATLPAGGMGAVSAQLSAQASAAGVELRTDCPVSRIVPHPRSSGFTVQSRRGDLQAQTVIVATDGPAAQTLLSTVPGLEGLAQAEAQVQRAVGCLYYSFPGRAPVEEPILLLHGGPERDPEQYPINNLCFPSVVAPRYAPPGRGLCSVTVLEAALARYDDAALDAAVRRQLGTWFPSAAVHSSSSWTLERIYRIPRAQPAQFGGPAPASRERPCQMYRDVRCPDGLFVAGDHVATATLNGALESGVKAGNAAAAAVLAAPRPTAN
jgi:phytoene dehydrogenase-like protein